MLTEKEAIKLVENALLLNSEEIEAVRKSELCLLPIFGKLALISGLSLRTLPDRWDYW